MYHIGTEREGGPCSICPDKHGASSDKIADQQFFRQALTAVKSKAFIYLSNAVCGPPALPVNHIHVRTDQLRPLALYLFLQQTQLLRQPDIVLITVSEVCPLSLRSQPFKGAGGAKVFFVAPKFPGKRADTLADTGLDRFNWYGR